MTVGKRCNFFVNIAKRHSWDWTKNVVATFRRIARVWNGAERTV